MAEQLVRRPLEVDRLRLGADLGLSQRRLHGWEPRQFHRGYDRDGKQVALADAFEIVVETEPEWDDDERTRMLALRKYERDLCACGFPVSLAADKANHFAITQRHCPVCAGSEQYLRVLGEADDRHMKQLGDSAPAAAPRPSDGRHILLAPTSPSEKTNTKIKGGAARGNTPGKRPA